MQMYVSGPGPFFSAPLSEEMGGLRLLAHRGFSSKAAKFWSWVGMESNGSCGAALRAAKRVIVQDVDECEFMAGTDDLKMARDLGIRAMQTTPLLSRDGRLMGMLSTHWKTRHEASEHELDLLDILARQAADFIERTRGREELELRVAERTRQIEEAQESLRALSRHLMYVEDQEKRRIARELHDSAGQTVAALSMTLGLASLKVREPVELAQLLEESKTLAAQLSKEIRTASYLLHPPLLDEVGLEGAVRWYVEGVAKRSGLKIDLKIEPDQGFGRLPSEMEMTLFRVVQEGLTNVLRHSGSPEAAIRIARDSQSVVMSIVDKGEGIPAEKLAKVQTYGSGVGLAGMRERVRQLGGSMKIESNSGGTAIRIGLPISVSTDMLNGETDGTEAEELSGQLRSPGHAKGEEDGGLHHKKA
jgi:signal transduction histidine kinase